MYHTMVWYLVPTTVRMSFINDLYNKKLVN